jgi:hypothetical protein
MSGYTDAVRDRAAELRAGAPPRTTLVDGDFAADILDWVADELDGNHADPTTQEDKDQ